MKGDKGRLLGDEEGLFRGMKGYCSRGSIGVKKCMSGEGWELGHVRGCGCASMCLYRRKVRVGGICASNKNSPCASNFINGIQGNLLNSMVDTVW